MSRMSVVPEFLTKLPEETFDGDSGEGAREAAAEVKLFMQALRDFIFGNSYFAEEYGKISEKIKKENIMVFALAWSLELKRKEHQYLLITQNSQTPKTSDDKLKTGTPAGSCNGIICLASLWQTNVVLYNPINREHRTLPPGLLGSDGYRNYSEKFLGFGFDKVTHDYKVVRICFNVLKKMWYAEVYRLSTNSWRKLEFQHFALLNQLPHCRNLNGVFLNGIAHWLISPVGKILRFDFETEEFGEMECSIRVSSSFVSCNLTTLDDSLAVVVPGKNREVNVWVMEEYGNQESWTRKFSITLPFSDDRKSDTDCIYWVNDANQLVGLTRNGELIIFQGTDEPARMVSLEIGPSDLHMCVCGAVLQPSLASLPSIS